MRFKGLTFDNGRRGLPERRGIPVPVRSQDRHDHLGRGEHLSRRGGGRPLRPPPGGRCGGVRDSRRRLGRVGEGGNRAHAGRRTRARARARASRFLQRFVKNGVPWVHIDLASSNRKGGLGHIPTDTTGFGVRYTLNLLLDKKLIASK